MLTGADLHYEGSLTVDRDLMDAADLLPFEKVQVVNVNNGARLETYLIEGGRGSGIVQLNGAAARLGMPGDVLIVIAYAEYDDADLAGFAPKVVFVDDHNRIKVPSHQHAVNEGHRPMATPDVDLLPVDETPIHASTTSIRGDARRSALGVPVARG